MELFKVRVQDSDQRRRANVTRTPPTPEAWSRYHAAKDGYKAMEAYEGTQFGGPDYGPSVDAPEDTVSIEYLETHAEWMDRCRALTRATPDTPTSHTSLT